MKFKFKKEKEIESNCIFVYSKRKFSMNKIDEKKKETEGNAGKDFAKIVVIEMQNRMEILLLLLSSASSERPEEGGKGGGKESE